MTTSVMLIHVMRTLHVRTLMEVTHVNVMMGIPGTESHAQVRLLYRGEGMGAGAQQLVNHTL